MMGIFDVIPNLVSDILSRITVYESYRVRMIRLIHSISVPLRVFVCDFYITLCIAYDRENVYLSRLSHWLVRIK